MGNTPPYPLSPNWNQNSYAYQEGIGQIPNSIPLGTFRIWAVLGVPSAGLGANNDFALRGDGAAGANTTLYHKEAGAWVACTL